MKPIHYFTLIFAGLLSSCVMDETLAVPKEQKDTRVLEQTNDYQPNPDDNLLVVTDDHTTGMQIDWTTDWQTGVQDMILGDEDTKVYAYKGVGATFSITNGIPSLTYNQDGSWLDSGFQYAATNRDNYILNSGEITFEEALGAVQFRIQNKEASLYLQVSDISLCQVKTSGQFIFPALNDTPKWILDEEEGTLKTETDTIDVPKNEIIYFPHDNTLPVIPQKRNGYNISHVAWGDTGTYIWLNCRIFNLADAEKGFQPDKDIPIWTDGEGGFAHVLIPLNLEVKMNETTIIDIVLENGCPWYNIKDGQARKILQPIIFSPTVEDWMDN